MRSVVIELAERSSISVEETDVWSEQLDNSDEAFLTNAVAGIWPVRLVGHRSFEVGETTRKLMSSLEDSAHV